MSKVGVIYWSGTGNTEAMAKAVEQGASMGGAEVQLIVADDANADLVAEFDAIALGCPSMGAEQLEEGTMEPLMCELDGKIAGKTVLLFGSYGWGNGEWMQDWEERVNNDGATVYNGKGIITNGEPDDSVLEECKEAGKALAAV